MKANQGISFFRRRSWQREKLHLLSREVTKSISSPPNSKSKLPFTEVRIEGYDDPEVLIVDANTTLADDADVDQGIHQVAEDNDPVSTKDLKEVVATYINVPSNEDAEFLRRLDSVGARLAVITNKEGSFSVEALGGKVEGLGSAATTTVPHTTPQSIVEMSQSCSILNSHSVKNMDASPMAVSKHEVWEVKTLAQLGDVDVDASLFRNQMFKSIQASNVNLNQNLDAPKNDLASVDSEETNRNVSIEYPSSETDDKSHFDPENHPAHSPMQFAESMVLAPATFSYNGSNSCIKEGCKGNIAD